MKEIIIRDCTQCPYGEIKDPGEKSWMFCELHEKKIGSFQKVVCQERFSFPEFCGLAEFGEEIKYLVAQRNVDINSII